MINAKTMRGLHAALLDCVPGKAQRTRLLEALARVSGNKTVSAAIAWLKAREEEITQTPRSGSAAPCQRRQKSGAIKAKMVTYSQAAPEVHVTLGRTEAIYLTEQLAHLDKEPRDYHLLSTGTSVGDLYVALRRALEGDHSRG